MAWSGRIGAAQALRIGAMFFLCVSLMGIAPAQAQFAQQGSKLVGTGPTGTSAQGFAPALSADGNTMLVGGTGDHGNLGAVWVFVRNGTSWTQQGNKLVPNDNVGAFITFGQSIGLSADGNIALIGGSEDNNELGAAWVFTRSGGVWTQQGSKLVPNDAISAPNNAGVRVGFGVALSADGATALIGGPNDNNFLGATWVFTRNGTIWTQQAKLVGTGPNFSGSSISQGASVALSADGTTALTGASGDNFFRGAAWVFTRSGGVWTQQGDKLVPTGAGPTGQPQFGSRVALAADGNTALISAPLDDFVTGGAFVFTRSGGVWTQQGGKLFGADGSGQGAQGSAMALSGDGNLALLGSSTEDSNTGAVRAFIRSGGVWSPLGKKFIGSGAAGAARQGVGVALSTDGRTAAIGGFLDNGTVGATWPFVLNVTPVTDIVATGNLGGPFTPASFDYTLYASGAPVDFTIAGVPDWLTASPNAGTIPAGGSQVVTFSVNGTANGKAGGTYGPTTITINGVAATAIKVTLNVVPPQNVTLASAVLPSSRSVQIGTAATAFATVINTSAAAGVNCGLGLGSNIAAGFKFQTTDPATNAATGAPNTPAAIPAGQAQSYVFALTPSAAFAPTDVAIIAGCSNSSAPAPSVVGLNTLLLSASTDPVPDIVALAATASNDGIISIPANGIGAFALATVNVGASASLSVGGDTGGASLPLAVSVCQTNPSTGQCMQAPATAVSVIINANATPTFAVFVTASGAVPFDPAKNRVFVRFKDSGGLVRGATSVAVRTQ